MTCKQQGHAFVPEEGQFKWWAGDPQTIPLWIPGPHELIHTAKILTPEQCKILMDCYDRTQVVAAGTTGDELWRNRFIWSNLLPPTEVDAMRIMQQVRHYSAHVLMEKFKCGLLYSDTAQLVRWVPGMELTPHTDNINPDGTGHHSSHRTYSSILYLNDDFDGGHTFFPGHGIRLKPDPGRIVLFGAGPDYVHGVTKVTRGTRYMYAGWFTNNPAKHDRTALKVY